MKHIGLILFIILLFSSISLSKDVIIKGQAVSYAGDTLTLYTYNDFITRTEKPLGNCVVAKNGDFQFRVSVNQTVFAFIYLGVYKGIMYIEPGKTYKIKLPEKKEPTTADYLNPFFQEAEMYLGILDISETDLNYLIIKFEDLYNNYLESNYPLILRYGRNSGVDSAIQIIEKEFEGVENSYFLNYKKYQFASLRHIAYERNIEYAIEKYFVNQPVLYDNTGYMYFFNQIFKNFFSYYSNLPDGNQLPKAIAGDKKADSVRIHLSKVLGADKSLLEPVLLKGLFDAFYSGDFVKDDIIALLNNYLATTGNNKTNSLIAENIYKKITRLLTGYPAPAFSLQNRQGKTISLSDFNGKYVYLNFCTTKSFTCLQHLELLKRIHNKYNEVLEVVTVVVDVEFDEMLQLVKDNNYNWYFLDFKTGKNILKKYRVVAYPTYYLIDKYGNIALSPAMAPNEDFDESFLAIWNQNRINEIRDKTKKDPKNQPKDIRDKE